MTTLVWFRRDLRLSDNPALAAAAERGEPVIAVYLHAPHEEAPWQPGAASHWWLHQSLQSLAADLESNDSRLILRGLASEESSQAVLLELIAAHDVTAVYWNRLYEPALVKRDKKIKKALSDSGIEAKSFKSHLLFEPFEVATGKDEPYRVFTPFWKKCRGQLETASPAATARIDSAGMEIASDALDALNLLPNLSWHEKLQSYWQPGEAGAHANLERFINQSLQDYSEARDVPSRNGTSRLSAHLHFGEISPRQVVWAVMTAEDIPHAQREKYLAELGWREFAHHLLFHYPHTLDQPFNEKFTDYPWVSHKDSSDLQAWQHGATGIDLVDAGMRELWETGIMHNRVRMVVGSLLTKNLGIHWLQGARWFWDTLVDADLANNALGWQWIAGCGADAAPFFRIFNPQRQAERYDPDERYIQHWLQSEYAVRGHQQPDEPIVDLAQSRKQALAEYQSIK